MSPAKQAAPRPRVRAQTWDAPLTRWFDARGWKPAPFQRETWRRYLAGESGLLHTPTGSGKTLAAIGGALLDALKGGEAASPSAGRGPRVLWVTPLRALAIDTTRALASLVSELGLNWTVAMRTGDATSRDKRLARQGKAEILVITPESLALLLSYADASERFSVMRAIVVDEWHELLASKRGVLLQLGLARLRALSPSVRIWGLSATLGNLEQARDVLLPHAPHSALVSGVRPRKIRITTLLPEQNAKLPWAGYLGLSQLPRVFKQLFDVRATLLFTNTRAQAELWHRALESIWPEAPGTLALHHGSLDPTLRTAAEQGLRDGSVRCVVATSSLDLGVDFPAVDLVIQIGSPKGVARLLQRAGRAKHRPGESGHLVCVPTQALDLLEYAAARHAIAQGRIEARAPLTGSVDVLAQHAVTLALGGGFDATRLYEEVRGTHAFAALQPETWQTVLDFIVQGGQALSNYPEFRRVERDERGLYRVTDRRTAMRHRLSIGTITSDGAVSVKYMRGGGLGSVEERFLAKLRPGDRFQFAGRTLQLVRLENMTAYVKRAPSGQGPVATWEGGRMPLSTELADAALALLLDPGDHAEMQALADFLAIQARSSALPARAHLLVERIVSRHATHVCVYPFAGRAVHEAMAATMAARWSRQHPNTFSFTVNDYGFMLTLAEDAALTIEGLRTLLDPVHAIDDLRAGVNLSELARRQFRDIARVAGLLVPSLPSGASRTVRQVQASSGLLYDVLVRYDPDHVLLKQAEEDVFRFQLQADRLRVVLTELAGQEVILTEPTALTPFSFPLWTESLRGQVSSETWQKRVARAAEQLEKRYARRV